MSGTSQASPHVAGAVATCLGSGGAAGPCTGLTPAKIIERTRNRALAAGAAFGFRGDPFDPLGPSVFGPAIRAGGGAATGAVTTIGERTAHAEGTVFPDGRATTYRFEYGPSTAYGQSSAGAPAGGGDFPLSVGADLAGLAPATTYQLPAGRAGPSAACRTWKSRLSTARRRLVSAKRTARRAPSTANRKRVKRAGGDVAKARREVARRC